MSENTARVALYIRTASTERVHHLEQLLREYAATSIGGDLCEVFTDLGGSRRRPGLDTAFAAAQTGRFDVLLVNSMHELTGAPRLRQIVERFHAASVTVRSLTEQFDSTSWSAGFWMYVVEIRPVDEFPVGVYRSLAGPQGAVRALPPRPPAGDAR